MIARARIVVDPMGFPPLRIGEGFHIRQGGKRRRVFVCFLIGAGCSLSWVSGAKPTHRTLANAKSVADRRYCGERSA